MSGPPVPAPRTRSFRWLRLTLLVVLPLALVGGLYVFLMLSADWELQQAIAEADRLEEGKGWQLPELEERRYVPSEDENSAPQVLLARSRLPGRWGGAAGFYELFQEQPPEARVNEQQVDALRAALGKAAAALPAARKVAELPRGRYVVHYSPDWIGTLIPHVDQARDLQNLLQYDAMLRSQDGDADGALESCRAIFNTGRSIGDELFAISQL